MSRGQNQNDWLIIGLHLSPFIVLVIFASLYAM
jgi:hypothetical protein